MSPRRWIIAAWAGLCLTGIAAISALNAGPYTDKPKSPTEKPVPTGTYVVDCQEIADDIEQAHAEAERQEVLNPSATPTYQGRATIKDFYFWVSEECADELEDRGLKTR